MLTSEYYFKSHWYKYIQYIHINNFTFNSTYILYFKNSVWSLKQVKHVIGKSLTKSLYHDMQ